MVVVMAYNQDWFAPANGPVEFGNKFGNKNDSQAVGSTGKSLVLPDGFELRGGVVRSKADLDPQEPLELPEIGENAIGKRIGRSPEVDPNTNKYTKSLAQAVSQPTQFPERLGVMFIPKQFDEEAFAKDPQAYLTTVEPGRIWQTKSPGPGVESLKRESLLYHEVVQGETVELRVRGVKNGVVTFHSFALGFFENQLTTMTVQADEQGLASVNFTAGGGTYGELDLLAASPLNSGQVNFVVNVSLPEVALNPRAISP